MNRSTIELFWFFGFKLTFAQLDEAFDESKILCIFRYAQDFFNWPDEAFEEMDTLAVQQYIQQLIKHDPSDIETILRMPDGQDEGVWKYEHLR